MPDTIEYTGKTVLQHGTENNRVYVMKLDLAQVEKTLDEVEALASREHYSKIFGKIPASAAPAFQQRGYATEATIPNFFSGRENVCFMSRFLDPRRCLDVNGKRCDEVLHIALQKADACPERIALEPEWLYRICSRDDVKQITELYRTVFESYPFPIHDPDYILATMKTHVIYFGIWHGPKLVALSSAEMDSAASNVEMTDFATLPDYRGNGFGRFLLQQMEVEMLKRNIKTAYTIARAVSVGMNVVFTKQGYAYGGRLICNTDICGQLESMNIWYKPLLQLQF